MKNKKYLNLFIILFFIFSILTTNITFISYAYDAPSPYIIVAKDTSGGSQKLGQLAGAFLNIVR